MSYDATDTICALSTAPGGAARGIVRVSGSNTGPIVAKLFHAGDETNLEHVGRATALKGNVAVTLHDDRVHEIPCDVFLWPTARSFTREPIAEFHTFGSPPLLQSLMAAVCRAGARLAEPGEFTLRAFLAGRIDLTQAEAVLGVIDAQGEAEYSAAIAQLSGGLAHPLHELREQLLQLLAELEAGLDFVDEDIQFISAESLLARLELARESLRAVADQMQSRSTADATAQVALVGEPNAGKSSLFNAMVARFAATHHSVHGAPATALVSSLRGTTRDYLTATLDLRGVRCELLDTAGIDELSASSLVDAAQTIESQAQAFATQRRAAATIRVRCLAADSTSRTTAANLPEVSHRAACEISAVTKADLISDNAPTAGMNAGIVITSSHTGQGIDALAERIRALLATEYGAQQHQIVATTADRCRESIRLANAAIERTWEIVRRQQGDELAANELRIALSELGKVVGAVYTDDILDRVFSTFCIGK
jgi:tRNA modification GTPase